MSFCKFGGFGTTKARPRLVPLFLSHYVLTWLGDHKNQILAKTEKPKPPFHDSTTKNTSLKHFFRFWEQNLSFKNKPKNLLIIRSNTFAAKLSINYNKFQKNNIESNISTSEIETWKNDKKFCRLDRKLDFELTLCCFDDSNEILSKTG